VLYHSAKLKTIILQKYWTSLFRKKCNRIGSEPNINGKVKFSGPGKLICGNFLFLQCERFNPIKIHIEENAELLLGDQVFLNNGVQLSCSNKIHIGNHIDIADECLIIDNDFHGVGDNLPKKAPIIIEDDVWLATRVIVLKGVTIGKGSVIGAGSIVTKSIPPNSFAAGVPAKVLRSI
jgi:acetyltransferase-like isoleucine patch superfamily enzyme